MPLKPISNNYGKEKYAIYTGHTSPHFHPIISGITYPDSSYKICRPTGENIYVFEYVISGKGYVRHGSEEFTMQEGDAYILHAGVPQYYYADKKDPWEKIWFNVDGTLVRHMLTDYNLDWVLKIPEFGNSGYLPDIFHAIEKEPVHCENELALLLHQHIQTLSGFMENKLVNSSQAHIMKNYIEQNLTHPLSIEDIAKQVNLSRSRALHLYKETYHITPYNYYLSLRLDLAKTMLKRTTLSIQEISDRMSFTDYHHFSSFFKKGAGVSPSDYRSSK